MAKKKPKKRSSGRQTVNVNVNLPKQFLQGAANSAGKRAGQAAAGLIIAHPIAAIVAVLIGLALIIILGGLALVSVIEILFQPWMWIVSLLVSMGIGLRPKGTMFIIGVAIVVGGLFWGVNIYLEYIAMQAVCQIPILGMIICGTWNVITFFPRMFSLGIYIATAFIQLTLISALIYAIVNRGR